MKRKLVTLLATGVALAVFASCGASTDTADSAAASGDAQVGAGGGEHTVAMVLNSSISDGGWGAACYDALTTASEELGWNHEYSDNVQQAEYVDTITSYASLGVDLIFIPGNEYTDATVQVAADYPDINFVVLNGSEEILTDNISCVMPDSNQIGWMAGALAGLMSESNTIGFVGGMELDTTQKKMNGFIDGAQVVNPDIELVHAYAGSYSDTAKGLELGTSMIEQGADVFFGDASAVDSGVRQAIDAANGDGDIAIFDIGQPSDLIDQNPCVIFSVVTDNAQLLAGAMNEVMDGSFGNTMTYGNLENGGLLLGTFNDELVSAEIQEEYMVYLEQMEAGTFLSGEGTAATAESEMAEDASMDADSSMAMDSSMMDESAA